MGHTLMLLVLIIAVPFRKALQILDRFNEHVLQFRALVFVICVESVVFHCSRG